MEEGINILTTGHNVVVEGAEQLIEEWEAGTLTREELTKKLMDLETVYIDLQKVNEPTEFKDIKE